MKLRLIIFLFIVCGLQASAVSSTSLLNKEYNSNVQGQENTNGMEIEKRGNRCLEAKF